MSKAARDFHRKSRGLLVTRLMARDGDLCGICGAPLDRRVRDELSPEYITLDHVVPLSKGGLDQWDNLRLAHARCNHTRGNGDA